MKLRMTKPFLMGALFVMLVGLACSFGGGEPTAVPVPTLPPPSQAPPPTMVPPTEAALPALVPPTEAVVLPTQNTEGGGSDAGAGTLELDSTVYQHPSGLFSINPPLGWSASEDEGSASFLAPDESGFVYVQATNVGVILDDAAFGRFILAREANFFADFDDYVEQAQDIDPSIDLGTVVKELSFDGIPQTVLSAYMRRGEAIYALDLWADSDKFDQYSTGYLDMFDSLFTDPANISDQELYYWIFTFFGPGDLFSIEVPVTWRYTNEVGENTVVDSFWSPDEHALIQNIAYDDGTAVSKNDAGTVCARIAKQLVLGQHHDHG